MFAKLKKKIESEGSATANSDSPAKSGNRRDSVTSLPRAGSIQHLGPSPPGSVTSEDSSMRDVTSTRDEMAILLQRKADQCKKLEGNISDLAALIKDKSKTIEKLESAIKQHEEVTNKKLQEQKEEFERYRDKLIEGYQTDKLKLDKEKHELMEQLMAAEQYRERYFKKEEENDEFEGLTTQELAKVKHLLLNTEEILNSCRTELEMKTRQCTTAEIQVEKLTDELGPLRQKLTVLEAENLRLKEANSERAELVTSLTKDKTAFDKRLQELTKEMIEKEGLIRKFQAQLADLDGEHKTLIRNSDLQRNKSSKLFQEKDDHIDTLQERVKTLEQRISDSSLSGDDRLSALQAERDLMEQKLAEARQQLIEIKSTWSEKITQMEDQISHLNAKIVEDSEELTNQQKMTEQMQESFHKQIEDLRAKLDEAEKRALEGLELATSKETHYEKKIETLETEMNQQSLHAEECEAQLKAKITCLESQLSEMESTRGSERNEAKSKMAELQEQAVQLSDKQKQLEETRKELQAVIIAKDKEMRLLQEQIQEGKATDSAQSSTILSLQQQIVELEVEREQLQKEKEELDKHLRLSEEEKGSLLERNADLYQQVQLLKSSNSNSMLELERTLELKTQTAELLKKSEATLRHKLESLERQIEQNEIFKAESGLYSDRIDEMNQLIASLQAQLADKNRTVKKQEQTLKDLRQTLQRELKVQSLPNDETVDQTGNGAMTISPALSRRFGSETHLSPRVQEQQHFFQQQNYNQSNLPRNSPSGNPAAAAVLPVHSSSSNMTTLTASSASVPSGATDALTIHTASVKRELDKDVNFQYLKHVVLKFMLSRESEAIQLIKAVSMLLNFSHQEQQLIRETLEWKMSWFGHRPPLGKGQTSKVIPPML